MTLTLISGGTVKVSAPSPSFTQVKPPGAPSVLVIPGGPRGPAGRSITSVIRTSGTGAPGTTDTYTITFSDDTTATFDVYNGADGSSGVASVNGKTGPAVVLAASDVGAVPTARTITAGTGLTGGGALSADRTLVVSYGTAAGTAAQGNDSRITGAAQKASNLSDLASAATARTNLGAAANTLGGSEKVAALSATTGTATGNCANASVFTVAPTGAITLAFTNVPATGTSCTVTVVVTQGATAYAVSLPTGGVWLGSAPTQAASKACIITLLTVNGGTTWYASGAVQA